MFYVVVAGSRSFSDFDRLCADLDFLLSRRWSSVVLVCGGCPSGADALVARYARLRGLPLRVMPAAWAAYGAAAGPIRNGQMVSLASAAVAYWDGRSSGTRDFIARCRRAGVRCAVRMF